MSMMTERPADEPVVLGLRTLANHWATGSQTADLARQAADALTAAAAREAAALEDAHKAWTVAAECRDTIKGMEVDAHNFVDQIATLRADLAAAHELLREARDFLDSTLGPPNLVGANLADRIDVLLAGKGGDHE